MKKVMLGSATAACLTVAAAYLAGHADPDRNVARRVLADDGYTNIVVANQPGFFSIFAGCDQKRYRFTTSFEATVTGRRVTGVVCSTDATGTPPQVRRYD